MARLPLKHDRDLFEKLKFDQNGLITAAVQEAGTGAVLMVAYMNRESLRKTLETGYTIDVPIFIREGDIIKVDTRTSAYVERINIKK